MKKLIELLKQLAEERFYGRLEIQFENGKIVILRKIQTIKVEDK